MKKLSFDSFTKKIYIKTSIEKLYWCWGTTEGICSWFLRNAEYTTADGSLRGPGENIQAGDNYVWEWHNWNGQEKGRVLRANGKDYLEISFADVSKVSVTMEVTGDAVLLSLKQFEIPTDDENGSL